MERENLFTKKQEKVYFQHAADEAKEQGKMAVLLKGFDNSEKNLLLDERAMKIKQASREHTIQVRPSPALPALWAARPLVPGVAKDLAPGRACAYSAPCDPAHLEH